jgi:serine/threonine protein kinase
MKQLHSLGYVHRDIKPDNIMINLKPLEVRLIDFNRSVLRTVDTSGHVRGTEDYFPESANLRDGSTKWDVYAMAAVILECDLEKDAYYGVRSVKETRFVISKYIEEPGVCKHMKHMIKRTLLAGHVNDMLGIDELVEDL